MMYVSYENFYSTVLGLFKKKSYIYVLALSAKMTLYFEYIIEKTVFLSNLRFIHKLINLITSGLMLVHRQ